MDKSSRSQGSAASSSFDADSQDLHLQSKMRTIRTLDAALSGTNALALLMGTAVLAVAANMLRVYDNTHLPPDFFLPLWPDRLDVGPTIALVVAGAVVLVSNAAALCLGHVRALRNTTTTPPPPPTTTTTNDKNKTSSLRNPAVLASFAFPAAGLAAAAAAAAVWYAADASDEADTLASWACRWRRVPMAQAPRWGRLCRQGRAALSLAVALVAVEAAALGLAACAARVRSYTRRYLAARKTPVLS